MLGIKREWWIAVMLFLLTTINSVDRLVLASVAPILQSQMHLSNTQYSYIVFAFMAGMTIGQLPMGSMLDRVGVRLGLPAILIGWSAVNILHVAARQVYQFSVLRLIMGVFESGNYSGGLKAIGQTMPAQHRAVALGFFNSGFLLGSVLAPSVVVYTSSHFGWQSSFVIPGVIGMLWIVPWFAVYRKKDDTKFSAAAALTDGDTPTIARLLRRRETWGVIAVRATSGPVSQFYWYWLPLYLVRGRGLSMADMSKVAGLAYVMGAFGNVLGGYFSGWLIRRGIAPVRSRKIAFLFGAILCTGCTASVTGITSLFAAGLVTGLAIFGINWMSCLLLAVMSDVFPQAGLARTGGLTGVGEGIVNMVVTLCTGIILDRFPFVYVFTTASLLPVLSTIALFGLVRPVEGRKLEFAAA